MRITELFTAKSIELDSAASNRDEILSRLVELQATHGNITDTEAYCTETTYLRNAGKGGMRWETARKPAISTGKRHFSGGKGFAIINNLENEGIGFEQGPFLMPWSGQKSPKTQRRTHGR